MFEKNLIDVIIIIELRMPVSIASDLGKCCVNDVAIITVRKLARLRIGMVIALSAFHCRELF